MFGTKRVGGLICGLALAGCSMSTSSFHDDTAVGGAVVATLGAPASPGPAGPPPMGAFLEGPAGQRLGETDRERAYQAELDALQSGQRKTWRGVSGTFGYVAPAAAVGPDGCRSFSHTIYIGGRPQTGSGTGCSTPQGAWTVTG